MNLLEWSDGQIEYFIKKVYGGKVTKKNLPKDLYNEILRRLTDAVISGFGDGIEIEGGESLFQDFSNNVAVFSAAKTYQQVSDMSNFIFDADGNKTAFSDFKKYADEIFNTYNENWLRTELNTAASLAQSAKYWLEIWRDREIFPYLKYVTVGDERVRHDHEELDGIIKKVTSPFWDEYFPPNDWNCRCIVEQLETGEETDTSGVVIPKNPALFTMNPAKSRFIFDETKHPYLFTRVDERFGVVKTTEPVKKTPKKPKVKIPQEVIKEPLDDKDYIVYKTKKAAKLALIEAIESESSIEVGAVSVSTAFTLEEFSERIGVIKGLFKEYNLTDTLISAKPSKIRFKSGKRTLGIVTKGTRGIKENGEYLRNEKGGIIKSPYLVSANFGDRIPDAKYSKFDKDATIFRWSSAIDEDKRHLSTTVHEFAHIITFSDQKYNKIDLDFWAEIRTLRSEYFEELAVYRRSKEFKKAYKIHLGKYSHTNADEFLAEGFAEYKLREKPSKYASKIGKLVDKYYKKK